jgi:hypothetical protein
MILGFKMKYLNLSTAIIVAMPLYLQAATTANIVEIVLSNTLDEDRGYCLDIAGGQGGNAPLDKGLKHILFTITKAQS